MLNSRKFKRFCIVLSEADGSCAAHCLGYLEMMWQSHAYVDGEAVLGDELGVKTATGYAGKANVITHALMSAGAPDKVGFIERVDGADDLFQVHDLEENAPRYVKRRKAWKENQKSESEKKKTKTEMKEELIEGLRLLWNELAVPAGLAECKPFKGSESAKKRKSAANARVKEQPDLKHWRTVIGRILGRPYCLGKNDDGWRATFEYLTRVKTFDDHFDGKFRHVAPVTAMQLEADAVDADHVVMRLERLSDKIGVIAAKIEAEEPACAEILEKCALTLLELRGESSTTVEKDMYSIEAIMLEGVFVAHSDHEAMMTTFEAKKKETGGSVEMWRDKWVKKWLDMPPLSLDLEAK